MITEVKLSIDELRYCLQVGTARWLDAREKGYEMDPGRKDFGIEGDCNGVCGEYAFSVAKRIPYNPVIGKLDTKIGDVGRYQIKTIIDFKKNLLVRPQDPPGFIYVLCFMPAFNVVRLLGWIDGDQAHHPKYKWRGVTKPCQLIPKEDLFEMQQLPEPKAICT